MSSGEIFSDSSMLEIFRTEVETHSEAMTSGLLALERAPAETSRIEEMMRAAHSIKGAARIVGIEPAVRVAHVVEDLFVAAQHGRIRLQPGHVDVLLRSVDLLNRIAAGSKNTTVDWTSFDSVISPLLQDLTAILTGQTPASDPNHDVPHSSLISEVSAAESDIRTGSSEGDRDSDAAESLVNISLPAMFDSVAAESARQSLLAAVDGRASVIRWDLSNTRDLDAVALSLLAAAPGYVADSGIRMELLSPQTDIQLVLKLTAVDRLYQVESAAAP
jgi:chemotaxis protein histidine kinase CheA